ncbi:dynein axonemal intermediate chain 2 [Calliopsis andreniformis]|uniref:dynein axonemal intermediate chain 2 n=1 Tax=Calliopsis andreniformis TaxID=337506 RepID=UPI003FCE546F
MEVNKVYVKTRAEFGKQCIFDLYGPMMDLEIMPDPTQMNDYLLRSYCHVGVQYAKQLALHEAQTIGTTSRNSGMYHFEGGWPREINPRDEETTLRFRRRIEKDDNWAPKLLPLFEKMEDSILQNGAVNIYQHYFDDMIPTPLASFFFFRSANVYSDPEVPQRPVTNISWSPDSGSRIVVSYCFLKFGRLPDYSNRLYIWQVDNPNEPYMSLEPFCPCVVCEFNPRDPSVLASGLMTGQVCNWDLRTGTSPVQFSHLQFSHREYINAVKWIPTKSNTDFFSTSTDGRAMWWDTRWLSKPMEVLMMDLENPNEPDINRAIGISCLNFGPMVGTKFMFGMDNGMILTGSRKVKTNAEKLALRFPAHFGPVVSVDRNVFNPSVFLSVGDWTARVWAEDTREGNLISTMFLTDYPTGASWNKIRQSVFYVITSAGRLLAWDLLQSIRQPIFTLQLCDESLTVIAPYEEGNFLAIGNSVGKVFLVESTEFLQSFDRKDRGIFSEYLERCSRLMKAVDVRLKEIKLTQKITAEEEQEAAVAIATRAQGRQRKKMRGGPDMRDRDRDSKNSKDRIRGLQKDKKKVRDELPEMIDAEQKYFEIVEKVYLLLYTCTYYIATIYHQTLVKYEEEGDPDVCPVRFTFAPMKKQDRRRRRSMQAIDEAQETASKDEQRKSKIRKSHSRMDSTKRKRTLKSISQLEKPMKTVESSSLRSLMEDSSTKFTSRTAIGRERKKKQKPKIKFFLPTPCKGEVCRPKVCCWRTGRRKRGREKKRGEDASTLMDSVPMMLSKRHKKRYSILREMLEPPSVLRYEVERAKREIREAARSVGEGKRYIVERVSESRRPKRRVQKRRQRKTKADREEDLMEKDSKRKEISDDDKGRKKQIIIDPCSPKKAKHIAEEFSAILGIPMPQMVEEKVDGKEYLEQLEAARSRVYPRISEFQSLE